MDIFNFTLQRACSAFQNCDMKSLYLSETRSKGNLFSQYQLSKKRVAKLSAVMSIHVGTM